MGRSTVSTKINAKYNGYATGGGGGSFVCSSLDSCYASLMQLDSGISLVYTLNNPVERTKLFGSNTGVNARFNSYLNMY